MPRTRTALGVALAAWLAGSPLLGAAGIVAPGERVRFRTPGLGGGPQQGTVVGEDGSALTIKLEAGGDPVRLPFDALERLEVARGRKSHFWTGAAIGFVPGALLGAAGGWTLGCDDQGADCAAYGDAFAAGAILGAASALVGGLVGLLFKSDRWERVSTHRVQAVLVARPGRLAVGVSFGF